jgi:hypothetical protein
MLTKKELENCRNANAFDCNINELYDIDNIKLDMSQPLYNRANQYFDNVKNPYFFRVGDVGVKINFKGESELYTSVLDAVLESIN